MSKAKFEAARELIQEKRYGEARAILKTLDHPTAKEWLAQLDQTSLAGKKDITSSHNFEQGANVSKAPQSIGFITLTCPSCSGKLQITPDLDRFACMFCGAEHIVRCNGGAISLSPVVEAIVRVQEGVQNVRGSVEKVQTGVDKTASELALKRLKEEIEDFREAQREIEDQIRSPMPTYIKALIFLAAGVIVLLYLVYSDLLGFIGIGFMGIGVYLFWHGREISRDMRNLRNQYDVLEDQISRRLEEIQQHERTLGIPRKRTPRIV